MQFYILVASVLQVYCQSHLRLLPPGGRHQGGPDGGQGGHPGNWKAQASLIRSSALSYLDRVLKDSQLPEEERAKIKTSADTAINKTIDLYAHLNETQRNKIQQFVLSVPAQIGSVTDLEKQTFFSDLQYFRELQPQRQQEFYLYIAYQISLMDLDTTDQTKEVQNLKKVLSKIHELIQADSFDPNQTYEVPESWKNPRGPAEQNSPEDLNSYLQATNFSQPLQDFLGGKEGQDLNKTLRDIWKKNSSNLNETQKEQLKTELDALFRKANQTAQAKLTNYTKSGNDQAKTTELNSEEDVKPPEGGIAPIFITFLVVFLLGIGLGYYFQRRNQIKNRYMNDPQELNQESAQGR